MAFFRSKSNPQPFSPSEMVMAEYKKNIRKNIVDSIKELQIEYSDGSQIVTVRNNELSNQLVYSLEALLIHGMKGSFIGKISSAVFGGPEATSASGSGSKLPEPSFWMFVLVFTHRETIQRIEKLPQITSDVGRCRAWLRLALNDGLLGAYLQGIQKDRASAQKFYQRYSIIRDPEMLDVITKYICGIEHYRFDLALNSSLLNRWQTGPLIMAGLWTPSVTPTPIPHSVQVAVDAMEALDEEAIDPLAELGAAGPQPVDAPAGMQFLSRGLLNEDEALKLILQGRSFGSGSSSAASSPVGTPRTSTAVAVRVLPKNFAVRPQTVHYTDGSSHAQTTKPDAKTGFDEKSIVIEDVSSIFDQSSSTLVQETSVNDSADFTMSADTSLEHECDNSGEVLSSSDSEADESIYSKHRRSVQEDSESLVDSSAPTFVTAESTPTNLTPVIVSAPVIVQKVDVVVDNIVDKSESLMEKHENEDSKNNNVKLSSSRDDLSSQQSASWSVGSLVSRGSGGLVQHLAVPQLAGFIESFNAFGCSKYFDTPPDLNNSEKFGFTLKPDVRVGALNEATSQTLLDNFDKVCREEGLDTQNYECAECSKAIGTLFGPAKVCAYTKKYYCDECHLDEVAVIPAKIVYAWNFQPYKVCHTAKIFLSTINIEPIIDVKTFNPGLFEFAPELNACYKKRIQLKYMNAYLSTCNAKGTKVKETLSKLLWPRMYLFDQADMFAVIDLEEINNGKLSALLSQAIRICRDHILNCILCQGKGFICEVCKDHLPIYPFDLESIVQCEKCFTVFHIPCSARLDKCPKCDRIEARNLNWHITEAKLSRHPSSSSSMANCHKSRSSSVLHDNDDDS